jgi:hypothetical protein
LETHKEIPRLQEILEGVASLDAPSYCKGKYGS